MKKFFILFFSSLVICFTGCTINKFYLDDEFYGQDDYIDITAQDFLGLKNENYILFTYNNYCALSIPCDEIFQEFMTKNNISFFSMKYDEFKNTSLHDTVRFAPSVIIVKNGKIVDYLDSEDSKYIDFYQDVDKFSSFVSKYVLMK